MRPSKVLTCAFYVSLTGKQPVRDWLLQLSDDDRKTIGEDIATLEYCWPIGKPKCSAMKGATGLYEVRSNIPSGRISRVMFVIVGGRMVLLHGFIKKTQKTPPKELKLTMTRMKEVLGYER